MQSSDPKVTREDVEQIDLWAAPATERTGPSKVTEAPSWRPGAGQPLLPRRSSPVILEKAYSALTWDHLSCDWQELESPSLAETVHCDINAISQISCNSFLVPLGEADTVAGTSEESQLTFTIGPCECCDYPPGST